MRLRRLRRQGWPPCGPPLRQGAAAYVKQSKLPLADAIVTEQPRFPVSEHHLERANYL